jgi:pentatricopeptide repeat protein
LLLGADQVWLKLMQLHAREGRSEAVEDLFQQMREAGVETKGGAYDALLLSYCRAGKTDQALSVFREYKLARTAFPPVRILL